MTDEVAQAEVTQAEVTQAEVTQAEVTQAEVTQTVTTGQVATGPRTAAGEAPQRWHAALAYALLGPPVRDVAEPGTPRVAELLAELGGVEAVRDRVRAARRAGPWPYVIPDDLRRGLGPAQLAAVWRATVAAVAETTNARPVVTDRALTADDRRLLADRPPHHGG